MCPQVMTAMGCPVVLAIAQTMLAFHPLDSSREAFAAKLLDSLQETGSCKQRWGSRPSCLTCRNGLQRVVWSMGSCHVMTQPCASVAHSGQRPAPAAVQLLPAGGSSSTASAMGEPPSSKPWCDSWPQSRGGKHVQGAPVLLAPVLRALSKLGCPRRPVQLSAALVTAFLFPADLSGYPQASAPRLHYAGGFRLCSLLLQPDATPAALLPLLQHAAHELAILLPQD